MTFEEQFPSLKDIQSGYEMDNGKCSQCFKYDCSGCAVSLNEIQKHCLDKQRVREAIEETLYLYEEIPIKEVLLNRLGL